MESVRSMAKDERTARVLLALASEPGDSVTGRLLRTVGATGTVEMAAASSVLDGMDEKVWQQRIAARLEAVDVHRTLKDSARLGLEVLIPGDADWPNGLDILGDRAPIALWAKGDTRLLPVPVTDRITIAGARAATGYGDHVAIELAAEAVSDTRQVISGGAYGIDGAAHRSALAAGGATIAVLAGGLDRLYPSGHRELLTRIGESGLLLSETPPGMAPTKWRFLQRGRLLPALSGAVVVVEAGFRSGSLVTAARAVEMGRPVGAVPGPITSAASAGCHRLLQDGLARIITGYDDVSALLRTPAPTADALLRTTGPQFGATQTTRDSRGSGRTL